MATTKRITVDELNNYGKQIVAVRDGLAGAQTSLEIAIRDNREVYEEYSKADILEEARDRNIKIDGKPASASHRKAILAAAVRESINNRIAEHEGRVQRFTEWLTRLQSERDALQAEEIKQHEVAMQEYEARKVAKPIVEEPIAEEIATVASTLSLPVDEVAKVYAISQEYKQLQQAERTTFEAETMLETVSSGELTDTQRNAILAQRRAESEEELARIDRETQAYIQEELQHMEQERKVICVEKRSAFAVGTVFTFYHPECYQGPIATVDMEMTSKPHTHVGEGIRCCLCDESVHVAPSQVEQTEQERQVVRVEYRSKYSIGTSFVYYHPECFGFNNVYRSGTSRNRYAMISHREVARDSTCAMCDESIHEAPVIEQGQATQEWTITYSEWTKLIAYMDNQQLEERSPDAFRKINEIYKALATSKQEMKVDIKISPRMRA